MPPQTLSEQVAWLAEHAVPYLRESDAASTHALAKWQQDLVQEQLRYQKRCRRRFPTPSRWLWTDRSLSQASDWWTASFKASIFPTDAKVVDACCGAGVDLVALAHRCHQVCGIDADEDLLLFAAANLRAHDVTATLRAESMSATAADGETWLHIDPDRRATGRRTVTGEAFSPSLADCLRYAQLACGGLIKLPPKTVFDDTDQAHHHAGPKLWCGSFGECRQQVWVVGDAVQLLKTRLNVGDATRIAVLMDTNQPPSEDTIGDCFAAGTASTQPPTNEVGAYVYDLDATLFAAELHCAWSSEHDLRALSSELGYYTADTLVQSPWCQAFEVIEVIAWDDRQVRKRLRKLGAGHVEIKSRAVKLDASGYQKRYSQASGEPLTLLITKLGPRTRAIIAKRADSQT